jgi:hypothetical protein
VAAFRDLDGASATRSRFPALLAAQRSATATGGVSGTARITATSGCSASSPRADDLARVAYSRRSRFIRSSSGSRCAIATERQKQAAKENLKSARRAQRERAQGKSVPKRSQGLSTAEKNELDDSEFAFPKERKEPLTDARHVRNAIARFDQVEGVSDKERDQAWKRILAAARKYDVDVNESDWRDLFKTGNAPKR